MNSDLSKNIYLQQIDNYIESGQGFQQLKSHFYKDISDESKSQENFYFLREIVQKIEAGFYRENSQIAERCINLLQDMISHQPERVSQALNQEKLAFGLSVMAMTKKVTTLHPERWANIKMRIRGLFLFWYKKFGSQQRQYYHLIKEYRKLRENNLQFPVESQIKQRRKNNTDSKDPTKKQEQNNKQQARHEIIAEIQQIANETDGKIKQDLSLVMNKDYVRILKTKNRYLYDLSTTEAHKLSKQQKEQISKLYKRIRGALKIIQAQNEINIKANKIVDQKKYQQEKIESLSNKKITSDKRIEQLAPDSPIKVRKLQAEGWSTPIKAGTDLLDISQTCTVGIDVDQNDSETKVSATYNNSSQPTNTVDLLDRQSPKKDYNKQKQEQIASKTPPRNKAMNQQPLLQMDDPMSPKKSVHQTPKKQSKRQETLLDIHEQKQVKREQAYLEKTQQDSSKIDLMISLEQALSNHSSSPEKLLRKTELDNGDNELLTLGKLKMEENGSQQEEFNDYQKQSN